MDCAVVGTLDAVESQDQPKLKITMRHCRNGKEDKNQFLST